MPSAVAQSLKDSILAVEPIIAKLTRARGTYAPFGGLKVVAFFEAITSSGVTGNIRRPHDKHRL